MDDQLINKYLRGEASEEEVSALFEWIEAAPENRKKFIRYKQIKALTSLDIADESLAWQDVFATRFRKQKLGKLYVQVAKYAAIFLLVFVTGMSIQHFGWQSHSEKLVYQNVTTISAPPGQMTDVELPDGTKVVLNSGSSLTWNGNFSFRNRLVTLRGEAYFDVTKDQEHPFVVQTASLNFKVFGTSFNIEAYPEENIVNTTLVEGSLGVLNKTDKELRRLMPGENAHFDTKTSNLTIFKVNTALYTTWKEGLITFRNEKLKDIAKKIERWYNVKVVIKNPKLGEEAYFGTIMKNKPIDQILEVLKLTSSLKYKIVIRPTEPTIVYWE
jgi:ferric-dicitrate binding protein FerR (iron transport regulator)